NVLNISLRDWVDIRGINGRAIRLTSSGNAIAVRPLGTDRMLELATGHSRIRNSCGRRIRISNDAASFFGNEEKGLVTLRIEFGNVTRTADCAAKIIVTERRTLDAILVVEEAVCVQVVVAEKLVEAAVNVGCSGAGDDVDLGAGGTAGFGVVNA